MQCPNCRATIPPNSRFCSMCAEPVPEPEKNGVNIGDVGMIRELHIGSQGKAQPSADGDYCPICGVFCKTDESFRCKQCGRANLHIEHRDALLGMCAECAVEHRPKQPPPKPAAQVQRQGDKMVLTLATDVEMAFVLVPAGVFTMGADTEQHQVHLDEYWIGITPVTNRQYQIFVEASGHKTPSHWEVGKIPSKKANHPVVNVSWHDGRAFCEWLSDLSGEIIRLPTEAEWEKAARGTDGRKYPWGDQAPDVGLCNFNENIGDTTRVGRYSPAGDSPYGCLDMAGNVWDWTSSIYKDYPYRVGDGREAIDSDDSRVLRGGSWNNNGRDVRSAYRSGTHPLIPGSTTVFGVPARPDSEILAAVFLKF